METKSASNQSSENNKKRMFRKLNKREKALAIVVLAALLVGVWLPERIIVSTSPSLNHRIFFLTPVDTAKIKNGDYLVFKHKEDSSKFVRKGLNQDNDRLIKEVGCSPGNLLFRENDGFYCTELSTSEKEKIFLGKALEKDGKGRTLPQFTFQGFVPEDNYFMVGTNPRSFDSRYFGFVHAGEFLYKALPLW